MIRVIIVDDQELFAASMEIVLRGYGKDEIRVEGIAHDGAAAVALVDRIHPDLVLMDVRMPVMDGVEATKAIRAKHPDVKIMILTTFDDDDLVSQALRNGATGYVLKNIQPEELVTSIKAVHSGNLLVSPSVGFRLVHQIGTGAEGDALTEEAKSKTRHLMSLFPDLRKREAEVLHLIEEEFDNKEIADTLFIAEQTVKNYISAIYQKLGVQDRMHAIRLIKSRSSPGGTGAGT